MHYSYYYFDSVEFSSLMVSWNVDKCEFIEADQLPQPFLVRNFFRGLQLTAHRNEFVHQQLLRLCALQLIPMTSPQK